MPIRLSRCLLFVVAITMLVVLQIATPVWAWGRLGHRVISRIAEKKLTPKARAAITALLEPGESLADASTWADEYKRQIRGSAAWHYVDVPLDESRYDVRFSGPGAERGCIAEKLLEFMNVLGNPDQPVEERRIALRFVVHLVGDLHQPLHVGDNHDRGGNGTQVRFFARGSNMHAVWDTLMIEHASKSEAFWLTDVAALDTAENRAAWTKGSVEDWATESLLAARQAYQDPGTGRRLKPGQKLADAYYEQNRPVVRRRLMQAGWRLAMVLNEALGE